DAGVSRRERQVDIDGRAATDRLGASERDAATRGEPDASRLLELGRLAGVHAPGEHERTLIDEQHAMSGARELMCKHGSRGAAADDQLVHLAACRLEPAGSAVVPKP